DSCPHYATPTSLHIFLLILRPPPRSPLFPYTTLFRSRRARGGHAVVVRLPPRPPRRAQRRVRGGLRARVSGTATGPSWSGRVRQDRKSTRLNSSHVSISYAVFCLKKKKN